MVTVLRQTPMFSLIYFSLLNSGFRVLETEVYVLFPYRFDFAKSLDKVRNCFSSF